MLSTTLYHRKEVVTLRHVPSAQYVIKLGESIGIGVVNNYCTSRAVSERLWFMWEQVRDTMYHRGC